MKRYIGTKLILAKPMNKAEYNEYRNWPMPADEDPNEHGYLIEYQDGGQPNDPRHVGYISWTPANVFRRAYRDRGSGLSFGQAIEALRIGKRVSRAGWNGKEMFIYYVGPGRYPPTTVAGRQIADKHKDGLVPYAPYLAMKTMQDEVVPWLASQTDMLAEDWLVLDSVFS